MMDRTYRNRISAVSRNYILVACAVSLSGPLTLAFAQAQQQASCEELRLKCQKDWSQTNIFGMAVTPPDKTKLCWDGYYACMGSAGGSQGPPPTAKQDPAPSTKPDATPKTAEQPPMKRFEMRSGGEFSYVNDCHVDGTEVRCNGRFERQPPSLISFETTIIARILGSVITGTVSSRGVLTETGPSGSKCFPHEEQSWPVTMTLRTNNEATIQNGSIQFRITGCSQTQTGTHAESQATMIWRKIE
jgi:hypothetical protein